LIEGEPETQLNRVGIAKVTPPCKHRLERKGQGGWLARVTTQIPRQKTRKNFKSGLQDKRQERIEKG